MKKKLDVGFVGTGAHATRSIYPSLRWAPINLRAICNRHGGAILTETARTFGAERSYTIYEEMFEKENLDAVIIVAPPEYQPQIAIDAMEAGIHVFVEKPPAKTLKDAEEMARVSRKTGKFLMVAFKKRFAPAYVKAREIIGLPEFGLPTSVHSRLRCNWTDVRHADEEYFLLDYAIHHLDLLRFYMGDVDRIYHEKNNTSGLLRYAVSLRFKNGGVGTMQMTRGDSFSTFQENFEIVGDHTNVIVDNAVKLTYHKKMRELPADQYIGSNKEAALIWEPAFSLSRAVRVLVLEGFVDEIRHFSDSVLNERPPSPDIHDSIRSLKLVYALCADPGKIVHLDEIGGGNACEGAASTKSST